MIQEFKQLFCRIAPKELAARELAEARLSLMAHKKARNYSDAMVSYNEVEIARLSRVLTEGVQA